MLSIAKIAKNRKKYQCNDCYYNTCNKFDFEKHINTIKHIINQKSMENCDLSMYLKKKSQNKNYICKNCNKKYKDNSGLWRHKQKCKKQEDNDINQEELSKNDKVEELKEFMNYLMKENSEIKNMMIEVIKNGTHNTINTNTTTNSHNKSFNLQFFLNETCKDAMNIMDFVDSIKLQLSDLERIGELGYVEGISNIILKNLNALDVTQRPVHCTDKKRDVLYVKDENKWEKEDENKAKMHKVVRKVADKNVKLLPKFKEKYPDCSKSTSKYSDQYNKIIVESMGGSGDNDYEKEEKIIKKISKEVFIDKEPS